MSSRTTRTRVIVALGVAVAAAVAWTSLSSDEDPRAGSELLGDGPSVAVERVPVSYRIVYRFESLAGGRRTVLTDRVSVRRPFESVVETYEGAPPGTRRLSRTVSTFARTVTEGVRTERAVVANEPEIAPSDLRPDAILSDAQARAKLVKRERRRVAGRTCRVWRVGGQVSSGPLTRWTRGSGEYTDACIDGAGLVLEEVVARADGSVLLRRLASSVQVDVSFDDETFAVPPAPDIGPEQGAARVVRLDPTSRTPGRFWELEAPPEGFTLYGRYASTPAQGLTGIDPLRRAERIVSVVDVWVRGADALFVERGATVGGVPPFRPDPSAREADVGPLGVAEVIDDLRVSEVRAPTGGSTFVRVAGTLPPGRLVEVARALRQVGGGTLVCVDESGNPQPCR